MNVSIYVYTYPGLTLFASVFFISLLTYGQDFHLPVRLLPLRYVNYVTINRKKQSLGGDLVESQ